MIMKGLKVLVVDPDLDYWMAIKGKTEWKTEVDNCFTIKQMNKHLKQNVYSLIIINLEFYKEELIDSRYYNIRELFDGPILFMTAKTTVEKRVKWLQMGIYDIWSKDIDYQELQLKIVRIGELETNQYTYEIGGYIVNESKQQIWYGDRKLKLAPIPYKLLVYLLNHPNQDLSRETLLKEVWNYDVSAGDRVVDKNINTLRKCTNENRIKTIYGEGYHFQIK